MGGTGSGTVTMKTVAEALGVSVTTVSNAYSKPDRLSSALREQILSKAGELGYGGPSAAGRALRSGKNDVCGFLFGAELSHAFSDPYSVLFLAGLSEAVEEFGASVLLLRGAGEQEDEAARLLQRAAIDALVVCSPADQRRGLELLQGRGVRVVGTQRTAEGDWVAINDTKAGRLVGKHLARLGHRDVVVVTSSASRDALEEFDYRPGRTGAGRPGTFEDERMRGLAEKLPDARIRVVAAPFHSRASGREAAGYALDVQDRPTAIVALSDVLAMGVWDAVRERGLAPGREVSIVGFDDVPDAGFLGITTVHQPIREKGRLAGRLAFDTELTERQITLPIELVVRASSGPAPSPARVADRQPG
ncbi:LacI family DNA-binding transcriptional regulator [Propionicimonas sp.]|uniref:LacI family DNA-binding transcriptional regulator n=1 Tax=Propionicimonas sp. TaxID=1955623 RepID=UPI0039E45A18